MIMPSARLVLTEEVCALVGDRLRLHPLVDVLVLLQNLLDEDMKQPDALSRKNVSENMYPLIRFGSQWEVAEGEAVQQTCVTRPP